MELVASDDIEAPIEAVFDEVSDFDRFLKGALQKGAEITRTDSLARPGEGMAWDAAFDLRGRRREMALRLVRYDRPDSMDFEATSDGLDATCRVGLEALAPDRTRLTLRLELKPRTLSARLLVQSLKLAKGTMVERMQARLAVYGRRIEERARRRA